MGGSSCFRQVCSWARFVHPDPARAREARRIPRQKFLLGRGQGILDHLPRFKRGQPRPAKQIANLHEVVPTYFVSAVFRVGFRLEWGNFPGRQIRQGMFIGLAGNTNGERERCAGEGKGGVWETYRQIFPEVEIFFPVCHSCTFFFFTTQQPGAYNLEFEKLVLQSYHPRA